VGFLVVGFWAMGFIICCFVGLIILRGYLGLWCFIMIGWVGFIFSRLAPVR
jgi:hypothetical protein